MPRFNDDPRQAVPDTQWLERMYNNRMRVPDHGDYFARWAAQSALARKHLPCELDVPYGDGHRETLDAFLAPRKKAPIVIFVHGGYWKALDKSHHSFIAQALHEAGAAVVVPNYAFCPRLTIPQITLQVASAVAWAWRNAAQLNGDDRRITVIGHSAGGHMAAMMLACAWNVFGADLPRGMVKGALGISGLYDLEPLMNTPSFQEILRITPQQVHVASPARLPSPAQGRFYSVVGAQESGEYLRLNRLIQQSWGRERVPVASSLAGLNHFSILDALVNPEHRLNAMVRELIPMK